MLKNIRAIRGVHDFLSRDTKIYRYLEKVLTDILVNYGYDEIRLPIIESTQLFQRAIGSVTDIVEKEMYSFNDRNGQSITLRPEGTAGCVRAYIEHGLFYRYKEQRLWFIGPMFRRERPQKGRFRQFHQLSVETFGSVGPAIDAEIIIMTSRFWKALGVSEYLSLELNSIGSLKARSLYCKDFLNFLYQNINVLDEDSRRRLRSNPIRILDSKDKNVQELLLDAPVFSQYLESECRVHFDNLCTLLDHGGVSYTINPRLIRGLDYYNRTVFEWKSSDYLGSQNTICAGGRYDGLVCELSGYSVPAIGFAIGLDRLFLLTTSIDSKRYSSTFCDVVDIYISVFKLSDYKVAILLSECIHDVLPYIRSRISYSDVSVKNHFRKGYQCGARVVLIVGARTSGDHVLFKDFFVGEEEELCKSFIIDKLLSIFTKKKGSICVIFLVSMIFFHNINAL